LSAEVQKQEAHLFDVRPAVLWVTDTQLAQVTSGTKRFLAENPPRGTVIAYHLRAAASGGVKMTITDLSGKVVRVLTGPGNAGVNRQLWNLRADPPPPAGQQAGGQPQMAPVVAPGTYLATLSAGGRTLVKPVIVQEDIWLRQER